MGSMRSSPEHPHESPDRNAMPRPLRTGTAPVLRLRAVHDEDCALLWRWANAPEVREVSFETDPIPWKAHVEWFRTKRADRDCHFYIVTEKDGCPVGFVRFEVGSDGTAEVAIVIDEERRGRGYGAAALRIASARFLGATRASEVLAYIKPTNQASIRAFERAGFLHAGSSALRGHEAVCMRLSRTRA